MIITANQTQNFSTRSSFGETAPLPQGEGVFLFNYGASQVK